MKVAPYDVSEESSCAVCEKFRQNAPPPTLLNLIGTSFWPSVWGSVGFQAPLDPAAF